MCDVGPVRTKTRLLAPSQHLKPAPPALLPEPGAHLMLQRQAASVKSFTESQDKGPSPYTREPGKCSHYLYL